MQDIQNIDEIYNEWNWHLFLCQKLVTIKYLDKTWINQYETWNKS